MSFFASDLFCVMKVKSNEATDDSVKPSFCMFSHMTFASCVLRFRTLSWNVCMAGL